MYTFENIKLEKLERMHVGRLEDLKKESWLSTHQVTIVNYQDQIRWFEHLDVDVNAPRNLVLQAVTLDDSYGFHERTNFGVFKIFNVDYINRTADVGWDIFKEFRGRKLGKLLVRAGTSFCFDVLDLYRLNAEILAGNEVSLACALGAGFVKEGMKRNAVHKPDQRVHSVVLGLLKDEWNWKGVGRPTETP